VERKTREEEEGQRVKGKVQGKNKWKGGRISEGKMKKERKGEDVRQGILG
jgi:hypothetical protein